MPKIVGWTHWDDLRFMDYNPATEEENALRKCLIAEELRKKGYRFNGYYHQSESDAAFGVPVFDDGTVYQCSFRTWGSIMAMAYPEEIDNQDGLGYTEWAWCKSGQRCVFPTWAEVKNDYGFDPAGCDI